jgi:hypothetical protein
MWTLEYFGPGGTVEKPFPALGTPAGWGISGECPFEFFGPAKSAVHLITSDGFDAAFQFAWGSKIIIRRDRAYAAVGGFSGGSIWFQGFVSQPARTVRGARQNHQYTLYNWVDWAERIGFRQPCRVRDGGTTAAPTYRIEYSDEVCLGETLNEERQDVAEQITEILTSMNQRFNPTRWRSHGGAVDAGRDLVQIGTIGVAGVPMPRNPVRSIVCFEALRECLRQVPDAVLSTDYTTQPPTVNVTREADMAAATLVLPTEDVTSVIPGLVMKPRYDRQLNGVLIAYKMPGQISLSTGGSINTLQYVFDKFPAGADPDDPLVMSYIIELAGARASRTIVTVRTAEVLADHPDQATRLDWWKAQDDRLQSARLVPSTLEVDPASVTVVDQNGDAISLFDYPYQLLPDAGAPVPGMGVNCVQATITAKASWHRYLAGVNVIGDKEEQQQIHARLTLCDLDTGGVRKTYSFTTIEETGESAPTGLAEYLYNAFKDLLHTGDIETVGQDIRGDIAVGMKLNIQTPGNLFSNNLIQSVTGEITRGVLKAEVGPPGVLGLSDIIEQLRVVRSIQNWKLPTGRSTGDPGGAASTSLSDTAARENTIPGFGEPSLNTVSATYTP